MMGTSLVTDDARERLDELISRFDTAMLITVSLEGQPRARPMAILEHGADGSLCFATRADDEKRDEILQVPDVAVTMQDGGHYLSISGRAKLVTAPRPAPDLPLSVRPWFPEGSDDPRFVLIVVDPDYAEFWDRSGLRRLQFLWEAGKALVRGEPMSDRSVGGHEKLRPPAHEIGRAGVMDEGLRHGFRLGECEVDPEKGTVIRAGYRTQLSALTMDFLMMLATSPGDVLEERQLIETLGLPAGGRLDHCLEELQVALGDSVAEPRYVRRVRDNGFQLLAPIHVDVPPVPTAEQILD
jgi:general stress protein 26/DNA-binding winged helix-turn-helix (wHTH) protein